MENADVDPFLFVNRCYGRDDRMFLATTSPTHLVAHCTFGDFTNKGIYDKLLEVLKQAGCALKFALFILMGFNISEGILYYKIFSYIKRYVFYA